MTSQASVLEYKCPCCNAPLIFEGDSQQMMCEYCGNTFDLDTVRTFYESTLPEDAQTLQWSTGEHPGWSPEEQNAIHGFICDSCAGELITDAHTAATFCPYCGNPTIISGRVSGGLKPEGVIPFKTSKDDAKAAFLRLCKGKPLLPKLFTDKQQLEKITGIYVPFWLYDCNAALQGSYKATRIHTWADSRYTYTKTDHYLLNRKADAAYSGIPMDGSQKMDDAFMESIEPFDYADIVDFDMAYLSGFLADKFDVESQSGEDRIRQRVSTALNDEVESTFLGYATVLPTSRQISIDQIEAKYVLLPVWLLNTRYNGKLYTFAMNGQTGKMTGEFPVCPKRSALWFTGIMTGVTALASLVQLLF